MNTSIDKIILQYHNKGLSQLDIANQLPSDLQLDRNDEHCLAYCGFLRSCGLYHDLYQFIIKRIKTKKSIPWFYFFYVILKFELDIEESYIKKLFKENSIPKDIEQLITSSCSNIKSISNKRNQVLMKIYTDTNDPQIQIERELQFCQSQKLLKKEEELLKQLIQIDSKNPHFQRKYLECRKAQAQQAFLEHKYSYSPAFQPYSPPPSLEEKQIIKKLIQTFETYATKYPTMIDDFAITLSSIGFPEYATQFLENHLEKNSSRKWLFLNLLLESRQFIKCLTFAEKFFLEDTFNSNNVFLLYYIKAQAHYGLNDFTKAKNLLKEIIQAQPSNELAKDLLAQIESAGESA